MRTKRLFRPELKQRNSEQGAALITAIFALLLVTLLGVALTSIGETSRTVSHNDRENTEALYIAEAGLTHALKLMDAVPGSDYTSILQAGNGTAGDGDELSTRPNGPIPAGGLLFGGGSYRVAVSDDNDETGGIANNPNADTNKRVVITSIGLGRNGATATVEVIIGVTPAPALLVEGQLRISGNPNIMGSGGAAHANGLLDIDGRPCAEQYISSAAGIVDGDKVGTGAGCDGNDSRPAQEKITVPNYDPNAAANAGLRANADYVLGDDGKVYDKSGAQIADASGGKWEVPVGGDTMTWDWNSGNKEWTLGGDAVVEGTYYADGSNIKISGNAGSKAASPPKVTLIAEGYIDISGTPNFVPHLTYNDVPVSMIAGTDLVISGNPVSGTFTSQGLHYAAGQLKLSGNPDIFGQVMSADLNDNDSPGGKNPVDIKAGDDFVVVSGNPTITYTVGEGSGVPGILSWREVRN